MKWLFKRKGDGPDGCANGAPEATPEADAEVPVERAIASDTRRLAESICLAESVDLAEAVQPTKATKPVKSRNPAEAAEAVWRVAKELRARDVSQPVVQAGQAAAPKRRADEDCEVKKAQHACRKPDEADDFNGWIDSLEMKMKKITQEDFVEDGTKASSTADMETSSGPSLTGDSALSSAAEEEPSHISHVIREVVAEKSTVEMTPRAAARYCDENLQPTLFYIGDVNCMLKADSAPAIPRDGTVIMNDSDDEEALQDESAYEHPEDQLSSASVANLVSKWNNMSLSRCTSQEKLRPGLSRASSTSTLPQGRPSLSRSGTPLLQSRTLGSSASVGAAAGKFAFLTPQMQSRATPQMQSRGLFSSPGSASKFSFSPPPPAASMKPAAGADSSSVTAKPKSTLKLTPEALAKTPLTGASAEWVLPRALAWPEAADVPPGSRFALQATAVGDYPEAQYELELAAPSFVTELRTQKADPSRLPETGPLLRVPQAAAITARNLCRQPLSVIAQAPDGKVVASTAVRTGFLLDELFHYEGPLGCNPAKTGGVSLALWAPTALQVDLVLYNDATVKAPLEVRAMNRGEAGPDDGVWRIQGPKEWLGKYYSYKVCTSNPRLRQPETSEVPDPYSRACSADASRTFLCEEMPFAGSSRAAWRAQPKPDFAHRANAVLYSMGTQPGAADERHLRSLAAAGVTHVHLSSAAATGGSSGSKAAAPGVLLNVPSDSFSGDLNGCERVLGHQRMVSDLNAKGLRVVVDLESGSAPCGPLQVLQKCVPGYYCQHELDGTALPLFAFERSMMERLMVDSIVSWVVDHRVDGLCFELASQMTLRCAKRCRAALNSLTVDEHGVDGPRVLLYAGGGIAGCADTEAESADELRAASQRELAGSGVSSYSHQAHQAMLDSFGRTLPSQSNEHSDHAELNRQLAELADRIRFCMAASLRDYRLLEDCSGQSLVHAQQVLGNSIMPVTSPDEMINCTGVLSEETLFDRISQILNPCAASPDEAMRAAWLCMAAPVLSHGVPHIRAGDELLQSGLVNRLGITPGPSMRGATTAKLLECLRVRASTPLLGLTDARDVRDKVEFPGCGASQMLGIVVMQIRNGPPARFKFAPPLCERFERVVVVISFRRETARIPAPEASGPLQLHPEQAASSDKETRNAHFDAEAAELVVPPLSASVFVGLLPAAGEDM